MASRSRDGTREKRRKTEKERESYVINKKLFVTLSSRALVGQIHIKYLTIMDSLFNVITLADHGRPSGSRTGSRSWTAGIVVLRQCDDEVALFGLRY